MNVLRAVLATTIMLALAGCGNRSDQGVFLKSVRSGSLKKSTQGSAPSPEQVVAAVQASLAGTTEPVALAILEGRSATAILTRIEQNGAYETWATPDRRSITLRHGVVTATRGLGNDLMSANVGESIALLSGRKAGSAKRVMRFLDGQNYTVELVLNCSYTRGGGKHVTAGELKNVATTEMTETCSSDEQSITNTYLVDGRGRFVQSRQWLSATAGHILIQMLR